MMESWETPDEVNQAIHCFCRIDLRPELGVQRSEQKSLHKTSNEFLRTPDE